MTLLGEEDAAIESAVTDWIWIIRFKTTNGDQFWFPVTAATLKTWQDDMFESLEPAEREELFTDQYTCIRIYIGYLMGTDVPVIPVMDTNNTSTMIVLTHIVSYRVVSPDVPLPQDDAQD